MNTHILGRMSMAVLAVFALGLVLGGFSYADSQGMEGKININQATVQELIKLPGIGRKKAEAIVSYRNEHGNFSSVEDIQKVEGIAKKTFEKIAAYLTVEGG